ncbi:MULTISPECIES: TetR/AcrR family transcriptional regulator [unclassified Mumia]|uniref:TetR/AcrR family transcriptional regulator n=1 Tax=unclassified Mumia TaxID=2621872 RepID=UPI001AB04BBE|nr:MULTISPECIES: TetR/AcrR family transcriptional regulator [unclassified Mumia]
MSSRLTPERTDELYAATLRLLAEVGYDKLTMDKVAEHTRSSKATLYRQWGSKEALVIAAIDADAPVVPQSVDTGSLRGDLLALIEALPRDEDPDIALAGAILHACKTHPSLAQSFSDRVVASRVQVVATVVDRAIARGEVRADNPAIPLVVPVLIGPAILRDALTNEQCGPDFFVEILDAVLLPALGVTSPTP